MRLAKSLDAVVLLSGGGSTFQNLLDQSKAGMCALSIRGVIASNRSAYGLQRARAAGVPARTVNRKDFFDARAFSDEVFTLVSAIKPDIIIMAGWMCLLLLPDAYIGRTVNIHPALLPKFGGKGMYGHHVHEAVIAAGEKETGCTVHFVDNQYDHGPMILQKRVSVEPNDTAASLMARVQVLEREAYPEAINMIADGRVRYEDGEAVFA